MEKEQALNPGESLALISEIIGKTKDDIREQSFPYLLWGWTIALASFVSSLFLATGLAPFFLPFPVLSVVAVIINVWYNFRQKRKRGSETYLTAFLNKMWLVICIGFFTIVFISLAQQITPFAHTIVLAGIGTLISGLAMQYKPLIWGGVLFFACAFISVYLALEYKILLQGVAIVLGNLVPGYMLKYSTSKN